MGSNKMRVARGRYPTERGIYPTVPEIPITPQQDSAGKCYVSFAVLALSWTVSILQIGYNTCQLFLDMDLLTDIEYQDMDLLTERKWEDRMNNTSKDMNLLTTFPSSSKLISSEVREDFNYFSASMICDFFGVTAGVLLLFHNLLLCDPQLKSDKGKSSFIH